MGVFSTFLYKTGLNSVSLAVNWASLLFMCKSYIGVALCSVLILPFYISALIFTVFLVLFAQYFHCNSFLFSAIFLFCY